MREVVRVKKIPEHEVTERWYIASDGREFLSEKQCKKWEKWLSLQEEYVFKTCVTDVHTRDDEAAILYHIRDAVDYQILMSSFTESQKVQLSHDRQWENYGPGWYMYFTVDGGDGPDLYYLWNWNNYLKETEEEFNKWKDELNEKMREALG